MVNTNVFKFRVSKNTQYCDFTIELNTEEIKLLLLEDQYQMFTTFAYDSMYVTLIPAKYPGDSEQSEISLSLLIKSEEEQFHFMKLFSGLRNVTIHGLHSSQVCLNLFKLRYYIDETLLLDSERLELEEKLKIRKDSKDKSKRTKR